MFESLIISFGNAWNLVKESVLNYGRDRVDAPHIL